MIDLDLGMFILIYQHIALPRLCMFLLLVLRYVVASAGVLAKDQRHHDTVEEEGCDLIPLVETFGVWSSFALN